MIIGRICIYAKGLCQSVFNIEGCLKLPVHLDAHKGVVVDAYKLSIWIINKG